MNLLESVEEQMTPQDIYQIVLTIMNILKGSNLNKQFFFENKGLARITKYIFKSKDIDLAQLSFESLQEIITNKNVVTSIIQTKDFTRIIKKALRKGFELSSGWNVESTSDASEQDEGSLSLEQKQQYQNVEIPDFMQKEIDESHEIKVKQVAVLEISRQPVKGKIRNSVYFVLAKTLEHGLDPNFLLKECIDIIFLDLCCQNNAYLFSNLLLVIESFKLQPLAIVDFLDKNYERIINQIFIIEDPERQVGLLKVIITLILEASHLLAENSGLFSKMIHVCLDPRTLPSLVENVLWMATFLCEKGKISQQILQNRSILVDIIKSSLDSEDTSIILQSLKLLTKLIELSDE